MPQAPPAIAAGHQPAVVRRRLAVLLFVACSWASGSPRARVEVERLGAELRAVYAEAESLRTAAVQSERRSPLLEQQVRQLRSERETILKQLRAPAALRHIFDPVAAEVASRIFRIRGPRPRRPGGGRSARGYRWRCGGARGSPTSAPSRTRSPPEQGCAERARARPDRDEEEVGLRWGRRRPRDREALPLRRDRSASTSARVRSRWARSPRRSAQPPGRGG